MYGFLASFSSSKSILADQNDSFPVLQWILKNGKYANFSTKPHYFTFIGTK